MADWGKPTILSDYVIFVDEVKARDVDAITLQKNPLVSPPVGSIKLLRSPIKFQEWDGAAFIDLVLSVAGGGTGSSTPAGAIANLGLGTMAFQNSNAVAITGGSIAGASLASGAVNFTGGTLAGITSTGLTTNNTQSGGTFNHTGQTFYITPSTGVYALWVDGASSQYTIIARSAVGSPAHGMALQAGSVVSDVTLAVANRAVNRYSMQITGDQVVNFLYRVVLPVGADLWAPV